MSLFGDVLARHLTDYLQRSVYIGSGRLRVFARQRDTVESGCAAEGRALLYARSHGHSEADEFDNDLDRLCLSMI